MILVWKQSLYFIGRSLIHDFSFSGVICIYCPVLVILVRIGHICGHKNNCVAVISRKGFGAIR